MDKTKEGQRVLCFDVMNILACLAVILLHHNGQVHSFEDTLGWKQSLVFECAFYWAVPVFLMISGANLLGYHEKYSTKIFFKKRFVRTVIPWLIWSIVLLGWKVSTHQLQIEGNILTYCIKLIISNKVESTYWFFTSLFTCYLMIPVLTYITPYKKVIWYIVIVTFILSSVLPCFNVWFNVNQAIVRPGSEGMIIYILLGYLLNNMKLSKKQRVTIYSLGIASFLFRLIYTYIMSMQKMTTDTSIKSYTMWHVVFLSVAVFVFLQQIKWEKIIPKKIENHLPKIASYSFGVYLCHRIVMYYEQELLGIDHKSIIYKTIFVPITYLICIIIIALLKKIPLLKKYIC